MMRVRNESRWIRRSLERTFEVCKTVILLDDGSTDKTRLEAYMATGDDGVWEHKHSLDNIFGMRVEQEEKLLRANELDESVLSSPDGRKILHIIRSPFRPSVREKEAVSEIRDKNFLWSYAKARVDFTHMLCLDGDEMLSREAIRQWPIIEEALASSHEVLTVPFIYLWDGDDKRRVDGLYGDDGRDGQPRLRFPRIFTISRQSPEALFDQRFVWNGVKGGFHCGSIPQEGFSFRGGFVAAPVIHFGYLPAELRQQKFEFYSRIDPDNEFEGRYLHIVGLPDIHAPGPVELKLWEDQ